MFQPSHRPSFPTQFRPSSETRTHEAGTPHANDPARCSEAQTSFGKRHRSPILRAFGAFLPSLALIGTSTLSADALACGCLSPPVPQSVDDQDYAVNQQAESILFEVEPGYVTAHVLIRYAGDPEKFAWIVPVPSAPELSLSSAAAFGIVEQATNPLVTSSTNSLCPTPDYICRTHPAPSCPQNQGPFLSGVGGSFAAASGGQTGFGGGDSAGAPPAVTVVAREQIGSYDTVTLGAGDAAAAVEWLQDEGFIVNDTMAPYMQPYVDMGMLLVASKLIPGADADEIKPLRMRFQADKPMIPLQLTAVASEPHLTVTAYVFSDTPFKPYELPLVTLDSADTAGLSTGRLGYPMQLARGVDEAGGNGFVREYIGRVPEGLPPTGASSCCGDPSWGLGGGDNQFETPDVCFLGGDGQCQCPGSTFDDEDCESAAPDLLEGLELMHELNQKHSVLTRLTTRLSPEEMTFDPAFEPDPEADAMRLSLAGTELSLASCAGDVIDTDTFENTVDLSACSAVYCGRGECAATETSVGTSVGCICEPGFIGRSFVDLDGRPSVTCVPETNPVDFAAGGIELPDVCASAECGEGGTCKDLGGFPACACNDGYAAVTGAEGETRCEPVTIASGDPGGSNYTAPLREVEVCAPVPADCGRFGWLIPNPNNLRPGVACATSMPNDEAFEIPPEPTCDDYYGTGGAGSVGGPNGGPSGAGANRSSEGGVVESDAADSGCSCSQVGPGAKRPSRLPSGMLALLAGAGVYLRRRRRTV